MLIDNKYSGMSVFYFFFVLAAIFLAPLGIPLLTVNEELFVFLSFLVFFDILGRTLMGGTASTADAKITALLARQTALLRTKLVHAVQFRAFVQSVLRPAHFRRRLRHNFVRDLATLISARRLEITNSILQSLLFAHKATIRQELSLVRVIFGGGLVKALTNLRSNLLAPAPSKESDLGLNLQIRRGSRVLAYLLRPFLPLNLGSNSDNRQQAS